MTTWNTPSDKGLKSRTEDSKNNSENIWGDFTEDFHQALHDTEYTENLSDNLLLSTNIKKMLRRKKQKERIKREDLATGQLKNQNLNLMRMIFSKILSTHPFHQTRMRYQ